MEEPDKVEAQAFTEAIQELGRQHGLSSLVGEPLWEIGQLVWEKAVDFSYDRALDAANEYLDSANLAVILGPRGGKKGGAARALSLSGERRSEIARKAAEARWGRA